jgi:hypothetical protein
MQSSGQKWTTTLLMITSKNISSKYDFCCPRVGTACSTCRKPKCRSQGNYVIYLLTAIGLSPGGSTHLHTNNTQNNTTNKRTTQITTNVKECGPCPVFASFTSYNWGKSTENPQSG